MSRCWASPAGPSCAWFRCMQVALVQQLMHPTPTLGAAYTVPHPTPLDLCAPAELGQACS
jgi:hypothetical protein